MVVTIQRNYVNCKLDGEIPENVFQQLRNEMRYTIPGHQFAPAYQKKWGDGYKYLITLKRRVFPSGLLYVVEGILQQNNIEYKILDLRIEPIASNPIPILKTLRDYQADAEKVCLEKKCGIIKIPTGGGKCINSDSYLLTSQGMIQLKDIIPDIDLSPGDAIPLKIDLFDRQGWSQSSHLYYDGEKDTKIIETSFGYSVEGTPKHRVLIIDEGEIKFKYLNEIQEDDIICIQRDQQVFSKNKYDLSKFKPILNTCARPMRIPEYLDASFALFLGLWVAEGSFHYNGSYIFGFSNKDSELLSFMTGELSKYQIHYQNNVREDGCTDVVWSGCVMSQLLKYIGCSLEKSKHKHIPKAILQSPREIQREFLRGYISGEAHIRKDRLEIEISSASYRLLKEVQLVLLNFGIICSLKRRERSWTLYIRGQEVIKYSRNIGFFSSDKQRQCCEAIKKYPKRNSNFDIIPVGKIIKSVSKSLKNRWVTKKGRKRDIYSVDRFDRTQPTYDWLRSFLKEQASNIKSQFPEALDLTQNAMLDNFFYDRVASVKDGKCAVYDFTVPKTHSFFANGFINHNTLLFTSILGKLNGLKCAVYLRKLDLMEQTIKCLSRDLGVDVDEIGRIGGGTIHIRPLSVIMIPTAARALGEKYIKYSGHDNDDDDDNTPLTTQQKMAVKDFIENADCFIVDECHALSSETAQMVSNYSKKAYYRIGCSATPWRTDGTDILLNAATGPKIIDISASTLIERKFLVPPKIHFYRLKRDWTQQVPNDYQSVYTQFIVENKERNEKIVKLADFMVEKGERVVILVQRQQHGKTLEEMLQAKGRLTKFIYGESSVTERSVTLDQFSAGVLDVLIGSSILNEGIDVPCITALINASGGKSSSSYYQKIGRAIRPYDNKTRAIVIDFIDVVKWLDKHSKERIKVLKIEPMYQVKIQD